ncbi:NAD-dependent epimerase/dehydratase family protein [Paracoccaceae bacterium]|nr:NAD-dependent epimerase/dehydratase family protein [Paracoccaceae bacterium]
MLELTGKKILVTGATGFVGHNLVQRLVNLKFDVYGTYFTEANRRHSGCKYIQCDLTQEKDCYKATKNIDVVVMCAANSSGAEVMTKRPLTHLTPNIVMNSQMLQASYENEVKKFVFISSNTVYPVTEFPVKEEDVNYTLYEGYHVVGWMKLFSEIMCDMYASKIPKKMSTVVVRPSNLFGPYDKFDPTKSKVIAALTRRFSLRENPMTVWGDGNDVKDFLYIDDFVDGLLGLLNTNYVGVINICSGQKTTIKDIVSSLKEVTGTNPKLEFDASKPSMIPYRAMDNSKIFKLTGWAPNISLTEGLKRTLNWYEGNIRDQH